MRSFITTSPNSINGDQIKEDEICGACSHHERNVKCLQNCGWKTRREETTQKT